jgi:hypothetical protein
VHYKTKQEKDQLILQIAGSKNNFAEAKLVATVTVHVKKIPKESVLPLSSKMSNSPNKTPTSNRKQKNPHTQIPNNTLPCLTPLESPLFPLKKLVV